ncbi:17258_t:CDS:2 [Gigaspora margarita]|uniref:17258_t:CDS:1 n=1 Tax=Gigaspora margarita TaxID=4874 RepID=A0ABN7VAT2_GIGMA|nr:17258_t:CDS:2 [Gigaspora margarita]
MAPMKNEQSVDFEKISARISPLQIDDSKDDSESTRVNKQSSEIHEDNNYQEQSNDSLPSEKNKIIKKEGLIKYLCKKKEKTQIQHTSSSIANSDST